MNAKFKFKDFLYTGNSMLTFFAILKTWNENVNILADHRDAH